MRKATKSEREAVLTALCCMSHNFYGIEVVTSKSIAERTGLSRYKVLQVLNNFRSEGLVDRTSVGCPAQFTGGEYDEMICDAAPPLNGWALTAKGKETDAYKTSEKDYLDGLAEMANGKDDDDDDE